MKYYLILFFIFFVGCKVGIKYPDGGFNYPEEVSDKDTNSYFYPLNNIESPRDAFSDVYAYLFYQPFNEPNLSIKPQPKEIFRLTYSTAFGKSIIISLTEDSIIVKKGSPQDLYDNDNSHLSEIEKFHLHLLNYRFPIDTNGRSPHFKHYLDSLTKLYPQLLKPAYYHQLYEKTIVRNSNKFIYSTTRISLTKQKYDSLIQQINLSGFWSMPYKLNCDDLTTDGYGFRLEANTQKKYKSVSAGSCDIDSTKFTKVCQKIIDLAKLGKEVNLISTGTVIAVDTLTFPDVKDNRVHH